MKKKIAVVGASFTQPTVKKEGKHIMDKETQSNARGIEKKDIR